MKRIRKFALNALILGASSLLMRIVSVIWSSYIAGKIGAEGMGLYSLIMSVYFFAVTFASSGVNLAVTRLTARELGAGKPENAIGVVRRAVGYCLFFGLLSWLVLFFGSDIIAERILSDRRTALSLRALSVSLPFIALSNVYTGYFTAVRRVHKNAGTGLIEQCIKMAITFALVSVFVSRGIEYACLALVLGSSLSEGASFLWLWLLYRRDRKRYLIGWEEKKPAGGLFSQIVSLAFPIAVSSYLRAGLVTVEHVLIPKGLRKYGAAYETALAAYGTVHGMALPLIYFPLAVCTTVAGLLVPELSELDTGKVQIKGNRYIGYIVRRSLKFTAVFGIGIAGILLCFSEELGALVYPGTEAGRYVGILAAVVPISYMDTVTDGMLKGLGQQIASMRYNIIDAAASVVIVYTLVPRLGITGYLICVYVTETLNFSLSIARLLKVTGAKLPLLSLLFGPVLCIAGATSLSMIVCRFLPSMEETAFCIIGITVSVLFYALLLVATQSVGKEERAWIKKVFFTREKNPSAHTL